MICRVLCEVATDQSRPTDRQYLALPNENLLNQPGNHCTWQSDLAGRALDWGQ